MANPNFQHRQQIRRSILASLLLFFTGYSGVILCMENESRKLKQCPGAPNCVNSQATDRKRFIEPIRIIANPDEAKNYILKVLNGLRTSNKVVVVEDNYIKAEFISKIFHFVDDVEFYFPDTNAKELLIHVRSASRVGYFDFGVNRKRIETIRSEIKKIQK